MLKGYRTIVFNLIMLALGALALFVPSENLPDASAVHAALDHLDALLLFLIPIGNMILRRFTSTSIGKKE